ncbi:MAG: DUF3422 domain-containing protein [Burkholderiaceae bacterium]|nr:DUF3422 domain-containing protein [Burkholderiaceae bacterium]
MIIHPDRDALQNEIHARPRQPVATPQRVSHIALLRPARGAHEAAPDPLERLCAERGVAAPDSRDGHFFADFGAFRLKRERHGEFDDYTVYCDGGDPHAPFAQPAIDALPRGWLDTLPGSLIAAVHVALLPAREMPDDPAGPAAIFGPGESSGASIADGAACAFTDFRVDERGFTRILVLDRSLSPTYAGRVVQRLIEVEVYRMMAMLAFPLARASAVELDGVEASLGALVARLESAPVAEEPELLREVSRLAGTVERIAASVGFRFGAARAYHALVRQRGAELRQQRLPGLQTLTAFLERRFDPAMAFCESVGRRIETIAERIARASALLRTRVEIERERHNQELLAAMNRRAKLQLHLQQTVEGLSVAAITYYGAGIAGYLFKAMKALGWPVDPELATGLAIVPIAVAVALGVRHIREGIRRRLGGA